MNFSHTFFATAKDIFHNGQKYVSDISPKTLVQIEWDFSHLGKPVVSSTLLCNISPKISFAVVTRQNVP
jgi:hypothetical protein